MARFFIEGTPGIEYTLSGEDGRHIARSLRMRVGETLTLCDGCGQDFTCEITAISGDNVTVSVLHQQANPAEPTLQVTVYQGLPKSDKMDWIAQKIVESGAVRLVPVMTTRCISRPDGKAAEKKVQRWQKIAEEAAKQSGRGIIPQVAPLTEFAKAVEEASQQGAVFFFYEGGGDNLKTLLQEPAQTVSIFIGPEGGFAESEVELAKAHGAKIASLGPRIFRTETAPIAALSAMMALTDNF